MNKELELIACFDWLIDLIDANIHSQQLGWRKKDLNFCINLLSAMCKFAKYFCISQLRQGSKDLKKLFWAYIISECLNLLGLFFILLTRNKNVLVHMCEEIFHTNTTTYFLGFPRPLILVIIINPFEGRGSSQGPRICNFDNFEKNCDQSMIEKCKICKLMCTYRKKDKTVRFT